MGLALEICYGVLQVRCLSYGLNGDSAFGFILGKFVGFGG
jgi:hypothetical protein